MPESSEFIVDGFGRDSHWCRYRDSTMAELFAFTSPILESCRSGRVSSRSTDCEGIEHSVRVSAESLYEAAVEAMAAFSRAFLWTHPADGCKAHDQR
jgi:hypothetical protein